jgi:hypothetical protein
MKIAEILVGKGYKFSGKKMWKIAVDKALSEHRDDRPKPESTSTK